MNRFFLIVLAVGAAAAGGVIGARELGLLGGGDTAAIEGVAVRRGPLRISVLESGNLESANSVELKSELEGQSTILYLIEEGSVVSPGDLLVELDATDLEERRVSQEIVVEDARSQEIKARQNLEIQKSQNESDLAEADRALEFAKKDLKKYLDGDWPQQLQAANDSILLAEEELKRAEDALAWSKQLAESGFVTRTELEADELAFQRAEIQLAQQERALELLEEYDNPRQVAELEADVVEAERERVRVELQAEARLVDFQADLRAAVARLQLEDEKLRKYEEQIGKAKIYAPVEGMVVYAKQGGGRWGGGEPIEEGTTVRERQELVTIPSSEGILVEASVHESVLEQVQVGQDVVVTVDALPDRTFRGRVRYKAPLPDQNSWWANPDLRVYRTDVEVFEPDSAMRPGMSCAIEVVVADLEDALHVPVQSVFLDAGEPVAFVSLGGQVEVRPIEIGLHNETWVEVLSGLREDEVVLLSQPEGYRLAPAMEDADETDEEPGQQGPGQGGPSQGGGYPGGSGPATAGASWESEGATVAPSGKAPSGKAAAANPSGAPGAADSSKGGAPAFGGTPAVKAGTPTQG